MLYSRRALEAIPIRKLSDTFDFDLEMIVMARVKSLRIREVAIPAIYADEVSHLKPIQYGLRGLSVVWAYKRGRYAGSGTGSVHHLLNHASKAPSTLFPRYTRSGDFALSLNSNFSSTGPWTDHGVNWPTREAARRAAA
jgi:hypothetical protein